MSIEFTIEVMHDLLVDREGKSRFDAVVAGLHVLLAMDSVSQPIRELPSIVCFLICVNAFADNQKHKNITLP